MPRNNHKPPRRTSGDQRAYHERTHNHARNPGRSEPDFPSDLKRLLKAAKALGVDQDGIKQVTRSCRASGGRRENCRNLPAVQIEARYGKVTGLLCSQCCTRPDPHREDDAE